MKKIRFSLPVIALVLAVAASAFTGEPAYQTKSTQALHFYSIEGGVIGDYIGDFDPNVPADLEALRDATGCDNTTGVCAKGFSQMNPTNPDSGSFTWKQSQ